MTNGQQGRKAVLGTSQWEAAKASRRSVSHARAVQESIEITKTQWKLMKKKSSAEVDVTQIIRTFNDRKIPFVLTGAHAIGGYTGRPRATIDVDFLVKAGRNHARAVKAVRDLYPQLITKIFTGVTAFFRPGEKESLVDITYPHRGDIEETLANPVWIKVHNLAYRIPTLEAALANKYGAMLTPSRDIKKRIQDALDFSWMVQHSLDEGQQPINLEHLKMLGEKVWSGGGGEEILRLVEQVRQVGIMDLTALITQS